MRIVRNAIIGGAAVIVPLACISAPAGAAQAHPKYINALHRAAPGLEQYSNSQLVKLGYAICADLNGGNSVTQEVNSLISTSRNPLSPRQDGVMIGAAVVYFCPAYTQQVKAFIKEYGGGVNA